LVEWQGIAGFLPASQLGTEHYPRVADGDKDRIFAELKKLIGEKVSVIVITADPKEGKLIFSEKHHGESHTPTHSETTSIDKRNLSVGDEFMGEVTGATDFGIFVSIGGGVEGLVHISEMDWGLVEDAKSLYRVGDKVKVKIIEIKDNKVSLSIKALKDNPWVMASKKYKKGDTVNAVVIKYNQYGALASIEEGVAGLVHFSEFGTIQDLRTHLKLGNLYPFSISVFDPDSRKMTLTTGRKKEEKSEEKSEEAPAETVAA
jgi:small subunit ribosomal protein S1